MLPNRGEGDVTTLLRSSDAGLRLSGFFVIASDLDLLS
jgi:hypothetical protein